MRADMFEIIIERISGAQPDALRRAHGRADLYAVAKRQLSTREIGALTQLMVGS